MSVERDEDEAYETGLRDGYEKAVQDIDLLTGGDGEYRACLGVQDARHCPDANAMTHRIVQRFTGLTEALEAMLFAGQPPEPFEIVPGSPAAVATAALAKVRGEA